MITHVSSPDVLLTLLLLGLQAADVITTDAALARGGKELNPITNFFMKWLGSYWWLSKLLVVVAAALLWSVGDPGTIAGLIILIAIYGYTVMQNTRVNT